MGIGGLEFGRYTVTSRRVNGIAAAPVNTTQRPASRGSW